MSLFDRNLNVFRTLKPTYTRKRIGYLGRYNDDGSIDPDPRSDLPADYVWVRFDADRGGTRVKNLRVRAEWGTPVWVEFNELTREDEVREVHSLLAPQAFGGAIAAALNVPALPAGVSTPTTARDIIVGGLFADSSGGLAVRIMQTWTPFGTWWNGTTLIELAPTATSSSRSFAVIGITSAGNVTTTLTTDRGLTYPLVDGDGYLAADGAADIKAVMDANPEVWWVAAVLLANGMTEVDSTRIYDLRFWRLPEMLGADGVDTGATGLVPAPGATDNVKALFGNGSYYSVIKADGTIAMTGSLNFNGQDANAVNWLNFDDSTELTISAGAITATQTFHRVDTESDASADDLDTISGGSDGRILVLRAENGGRSVVVKHNTGNIQTYSGTDVTLNETYMPVLLIYDGTLSKWLAFGGGGAGGGVTSVVAGANVSVDNTDPANPVVSSLSSPGGGAAPSICEGRLTLTSGTPTTTTDVTAAGTVYFAPSRGKYIGLRNGGGSWEILTFSELSISLSGLLPHSLHDIYCYNNSGTPTLELVAWNAGATGAITGATNATPISITSTAHGLSTGDIVTITGVGGNTAANGTFRITNTGANTFTLQTLAANANVAGSGAYTSGGNWYKANYTGTRATAIATQDGIAVKSGDATRRLLGTIRITSTAGQTEDSEARRFVSNLNQPVLRSLRVNESTDSWSYGTASSRPLNNSLLNRVEVVLCEHRHITVDAIHNANRVSGSGASTGIDVDGIASLDEAISGWLATGNTSMHAKYRGYQAEGYHYFQQLESANGASNTFYGDFGQSYPRTGMSGEILA